MADRGRLSRSSARAAHAGIGNDWTHLELLHTFAVYCVGGANRMGTRRKLHMTIGGEPCETAR
jgi:hypothetical protein